MSSKAPHKNKSSLNRFAISGFVAALSTFVCLNILLALYVPLPRLAPSELPKKNSWECHRALEFVNDSKEGIVPPVVLFGSSLMMIPSTCAEADYLNKVVDPVVEPYSYLMDHLLRAKGEAKGNTCFNFALPGAMISDHYFVSRCLFNQERKTKLAVLGISLRDFIDNSVDCAASTPAYNYFQRYLSDQEVGELVPLSMPSVLNRGEYYVNKYFYLFGKRLELMKMIDGNLKVAIDSSIATVFPSLALNSDSKSDNSSETNNNITNVDNILAAQDIKPGSYLIPPNMQLPWQDNTNEYKKRFKTANQKSFEVQTEFLNKMIEHHRSLGITTMLVNMPLTPANMKLMPKGSYDKYMAMLKRTANQNDVVLLELNDGTKFDIKCFRDTVHMNGTGGKKLMAQIASFINSTSVVDSQTGLKQGLATRLKLEQFDGKLDIAASDASSL